MVNLINSIILTVAESPKTIAANKLSIAKNLVRDSRNYQI